MNEAIATRKAMCWGKVNQKAIMETDLYIIFKIQNSPSTAGLYFFAGLWWLLSFSFSFSSEELCGPGK